MPSRASSRGPRSTAPPARWRWCFAADPQRRVYVRRIDVAGNTRTRDEVVRREFRQLESAWYDGALIKLSKERVDRLGYFKDVEVETAEVAGAPDQVDLVVNVTEKPTGNLLVGAGYSNAEKLTLHGVDQAGQRLRLGQVPGHRGQHQQVQPHAGAQHGRPVLDGGRHLARASTSSTAPAEPLNSLGESYDLTTPGGAVRFGVPFSEYDTVFLGLGFERTRDRQRHRHPAELPQLPRAVRRRTAMRSR